MNNEEKMDLTERSDRELSLLVFNNEFLYLKRFRPNIVDILDHHFIYTAAQLDKLNEDLKVDLDEEL